LRVGIVPGERISRDPIAEDGGINLYGYIAGDPINAVDPLGLTKQKIASVTLLWGKAKLLPCPPRSCSLWEYLFGNPSTKNDGYIIVTENKTAVEVVFTDGSSTRIGANTVAYFCEQTPPVPPMSAAGTGLGPIGGRGIYEYGPTHEPKDTPKPSNPAIDETTGRPKEPKPLKPREPKPLQK
jgi:uncharacterized protein RhaS with RHS repeats